MGLFKHLTNCSFPALGLGSHESYKEPVAEDQAEEEEEHIEDGEEVLEAKGGPGGFCPL